MTGMIVMIKVLLHYKNRYVIIKRDVLEKNVNHAPSYESYQSLL